MPGRISRATVPGISSGGTSNRVKPAKKRKQRSLDAFAIADRQDSSRKKVRQHRLGEVDGDEPQRKKQRLLGGDEAEDDQQDPRSNVASRKSSAKDDGDAFDWSGGSDSEGHEWKIGEVNEDDDSEIDSDEAFGESDDEKLKGFTSRRDKSKRGKTKPRKVEPTRPQSFNEIDLDEMSDADDNSGDEDDLEDENDLGEDAVDLAAMLDEDNEESENDIFQTRKDKSEQNYEAGDDDEFDGFEKEQASSKESNSKSGDSSQDDSDDEASIVSFSEVESEQDDAETQKQLKDIVESYSRSTKEGDQAAAGVNGMPTLASALAALKESAGLDPAFDKEVKNLSRNLKPSKGDKRNSLVHAPLPKRQQDRIDRKAAYGKAKETLDRWIDTVKHNRRAEHLMFPLQDPHAQDPQGTTTMIPTGQAKPRTDLEQTIQGILEQSGLGGKADKPEEDQIRGFENLQANKMPVEEAMARRAELRMARELLFREELRSKRIKKIKSKAYRRVHRKDAQRAAQKERNLLSAAGIDVSEDEKEANDRRRAEERMGARHRESRWAKTVKQTGRAAWDEDARDGVNEMARRNEELRQRMEGKKAHHALDMDSDLSSEEDPDDEDSVADGDGTDVDPRKNLQKQLGKVASSTALDTTESKLGSLKFMQRADAARRQRNDEDAERLRRELADEDSSSDKDAGVQNTIGRRIFGPTEQSAEQSSPAIGRNEFEEPDDSPDEADMNTGVEPKLQVSVGEMSLEIADPVRKSEQRSEPDRKSLIRTETKAFSPDANSQKKANGAHHEQMEVSTNVKAAAIPGSTEGWAKIEYRANAENEEIQGEEDNGSGASPSHEPLISSNLDLVRSAFGGDDVEASFAAEKASAESSEDEKTIDNALPGWGSWAGEGISKRERKRIQERNKGRFVTKEEGVKAANRKDKGMSKVIISEKRSKKNAKYLASTLPHPYESRQQYERTIRQPIGPEWTTKETFQNSTKPRVLVKPGRRIEPMSTPML